MSASNITEYSVEEISNAVRHSMEENFSRIRVRGEISSVSRPASGHVYLTLKQGRHQLGGIIWRGSAQRIGRSLEEGIEYVATGKLTAYSGTSRYQLIIDAMEIAGKGALLAMLEKRKAALQREGLFDVSRKKKLPHIPGVIGVVTSPSGAVIRDILHRLKDRFPRRVLIWPVAVQGESCETEVARAIRGFNQLEPAGPVPRPDLLIVARGGGSFEDLMGFNEENVVRAVSESIIPVISAIGHESDTTLIDFAADERAPTPTAAAEIAVPVRSELAAAIASIDGRLRNAALRTQRQKTQRLEDLSRVLPRKDDLFQVYRQLVDNISERLPVAMRSSHQKRVIRFEKARGGLRLPDSTRRAQRRFDRVSGDLKNSISAKMLGKRGEVQRGYTKNPAPFNSHHRDR